MKRGDPLEHAFELLKADSTELAPDPTLETRLMTELQRQNRPRRFKKLALVAGALLALVLTGGGIAVAAGYNPIKLFLKLNADGTAQTYDEHGNLVDLQWKVTPREDGMVEATVTMPQQGSYSITVTPPDQPKVKK